MTLLQGSLKNSTECWSLIIHDTDQEPERGSPIHLGTPGRMTSRAGKGSGNALVQQFSTVADC